MYIYVAMANLKKCSGCESEIDISYFGMNRKKEPYKTFDNCRNETKQTQACNRNSFMVQKEIESWFSSDNEQDDTRTQCYKQSCKEYYHMARKMGLQLEDVLKEKGEVQPYADILYQKIAQVQQVETKPLKRTDTHFIGENRLFGGNLLYKDLIPSSTWFKNVRTCVTRSSWDKLRKQVYGRADYKCECCKKDCSINNTYSGDEYEDAVISPAKYEEFDGDTELNKWNTIRLEAHERWSYDNDTKVQKLERIIALCHRCHTATHMGLAGLRGLTELAIKHTKKVNSWSDTEWEKCNDEQSSLY
jgi:hypothetical protein